MSKRNTEEIYKKLKELFSLTKVEKFADAKLKDGSTITSDGDLIVGAKVSVTGADGSATPAADGELEMEDGSKIVVKGGVIDSIIPAPAPTPVDEPMKTDVAMDAPVDGTPAPAAVETPSDEAAEQSKLDLIAQTLSDLSDRVASLEAAYGDAMKANTEMSAQIQKMSAEPAAEPIKRKDISEAFSSSVKSDYITKIEELSKFRIKK